MMLHSLARDLHYETCRGYKYRIRSIVVGYRGTVSIEEAQLELEPEGTDEA
jgi:hypothetical protein